MSSVHRLAVTICAAALTLGASAFTQNSISAAQNTLRVCADPSNLPYSNDQQQGFEGRTAFVCERCQNRWRTGLEWRYISPIM
jgi:hypothetical protein